MLRPLSRLILPALAVSAAASCSRDLQLPPIPPPGSLTGRVTYAQPGSSEKRAAAGAVVGVVGSGLQTQTNPSGIFTLAWGDETDGLLMIRFDADGDGTVDRQRVLQLADYHVGPNKHVELGDLLLGENASVRGRVLRGDVATHSGHSGSTVFLPEGPFTAITGDDGSFFLNDLPSGPVALVAFRPGYQAYALGTVELRSGEQFTMADVVLEPAPTQPPGGLSGTLVFVPAATGAGDTLVMLQAPSLAPRTGTVNDDLTFHFDAVEPGLYTLRATRTGYTPLVVPNVLVPAGGAADLGTVEVTDSPVPDGGQPRGSDGGTPGDDGGVPCTAGSCSACTLNAQCPTTEWCDFGHCTTQCATSLDCSLGRQCDPATHTCAVACTAGFCQGGLSCAVGASSAAWCRASCDGTFPCAGGLTCDGRGLCVPQCAVDADCPNAQPVCHAGQCEAGGTCATDLDCPVSELCFVGRCAARPTVADGGVYPCSGPCQCRLGEWCNHGACAADAVPTLFLSSSGTGDGRSMSAPSADLAGLLADAGAGARLALRAGDSFTNVDTFRIAPGQDGLALKGGYTVCAANRWVRDDVGRTTLFASDAGVTLAVGSTLGNRLLGAEVTNLSMALPGAIGFGIGGPLVLSAVDGPRVSLLDFSFDDTGMVDAQGLTMAAFSNCNGAAVSDVKLSVVSNRTLNMMVVGLENSSGDVRGVTMTPPAQPVRGVVLVGGSYSVNGLAGASLNGNTTVTGCRLPPVIASGTVYGVDVQSCTAGSTLKVVDNTISWAVASGSVAVFSGLLINSTGNLTVANNLIDGAGVTGTPTPAATGIDLLSVAGTVQGNTVRLPTATTALVGNAPSGMIGLAVRGSAGPLTITDNSITGGNSPGALAGLSLEPLQPQLPPAPVGPVLVTRNVVDVGPAPGVALLVAEHPPSTGLTVRDNFFRAHSDPACVATVLGNTVAFRAISVSGVFERNRFLAQGSGQVSAVTLENSTLTESLELYANHLWVGPVVCGTGIAFAANSNAAYQVYLGENTLDAEGDSATNDTQALQCDQGTVFASGNLMGGGRGQQHRVLATSATGGGLCFVEANYQHNLFFLPADGGTVDATDQVLPLLQRAGDGGTNLFSEGLSPYDAVQPTLADGGLLPPSRLAANSLAIDRGVWPVRLNTGGTVLLDLDGRPRDGGAGPDIGCCER